MHLMKSRPFRNTWRNCHPGKDSYPYLTEKISRAGRAWWQTPLKERKWMRQHWEKSRKKQMPACLPAGRLPTEICCSAATVTIYAHKKNTATLRCSSTGKLRKKAMPVSICGDLLRFRSGIHREQM